ncbi:hypothetical protein MRB53_035970 [Persea americana]|uniref:Uncharacterized protein n=1 Tax=Persea americana TaxID=3435 RepID=A0ACC2K650_PERAE|nr:hypothetical protein MRB53_035970 [Persea americana]
MCAEAHSHLVSLKTVVVSLKKTTTRKQLNNPSALSLHLSSISRVLKWRMGKGSKIGCKMASHQLFKDKAKNWVDDLQGMFTDLQFARKESRSINVAVLEEQVHQMLREWKAELDEASPASSLPVMQDDLQEPTLEIGEEFNQNSPKKKRRRLENDGEGEACKRCNCKKSKCLKL